MTDPALFRQILALAVERYPADRASYHVSARIEALPPFGRMPDDALPDLLEDFHAREILHVTYGSVLNHPDLRAPLFAVLEKNATLYTTLIALSCFTFLEFLKKIFYSMAQKRIDEGLAAASESFYPEPGSLPTKASKNIDEVAA